MIEIEKITSKENQRLKRALKAREGKSESLIFVEGSRLCHEALLSGVEVIDCFTTGKFLASDISKRFVETAVKAGIGIIEIPEKLFNPMADTKNSQGVILICSRPAETGLSAVLDALKGSRPALAVCLHELNNPSNLGAVLRTAEAAGVTAVITTTGSADAFSPKALRGGMGSTFRLKLSQGQSIERVMTYARERDLVLTAAAAGGSISYIDIDWKKPRLLVFGSEAHGLSVAELSSVDERINIPMNNNVESLNLAVACGIVLFEARRQCLMTSV